MKTKVNKLIEFLKSKGCYVFGSIGFIHIEGSVKADELEMFLDNLELKKLWRKK